MSTTATTSVRERPIPFKPDMVRAVLDGRKTQTRRLIIHQGKPLDAFAFYEVDGNEVRTESERRKPCRFGKIGDRLWVREAFYIDHCNWTKGPLGSVRPAEVTDDMIYYPADARRPGSWCCQLIPECCCAEVGKPRARNPRFMPRWASRITLEITDVCVERVQDISTKDAMAEGITMPAMALDDPRLSLAKKWAGGFDGGHCELARVIFSELWDSINGKSHPWASNPWVWVVSFRRVDA